MAVDPTPEPREQPPAPDQTPTSEPPQASPPAAPVRPASPPTTEQYEQRVDHEPTPPEPVYTPFSLTVGDGFKFGCGLTMALVIAGLIGLLMLAILALAASLVGAPMPIGR